METNELTRVKSLFESSPLIPASKFITTENGVSAKSWYPLDFEEVKNNDWQCNEMLVALYSTGLCKMTFSVMPDSNVYKWMIRISDQLNNQLLSFSFSPVIIESSNRKEYRIFKVEKRFSEVDEALIRKAHSVQVINA